MSLSRKASENKKLNKKMIKTTYCIKRKGKKTDSSMGNIKTGRQGSELMAGKTQAKSTRLKHSQIDMISTFENIEKKGSFGIR